MDLFNGINRREVLKYLGHRGGEVDKSISDKIDETEKLLIDTLQPKVCHAVFAVESRTPLLFSGSNVRFGGEDIKKHLENSDSVIFMAATLGYEADALLRKLSVKNMADAVIFDACASSAIENVCDNYTAYLESVYAEKGLFLTDRFSPGYGDMPLSDQSYLIDALNTQKRIGLCLNRSMMLEPVKSVTAVIGISKTLPQKRSGCESCSNIAGCKFREKGEVCYE